MSRGPASGRKILLTRPRGRARELARRLSDCGAEVDCRPTIDFVPPADPGPARRLVAQLESFDVCLLTSPTAVRFLVERVVAEREALPRPAPWFAVVGRGTSRALVERGWPAPRVVAQSSRAEGLVEAVAPWLRAGQRLLWPRAEVTRGILSDALVGLGVEVSSAAFYRTVAAADAQAVARDAAAGRYDVLAFTSPSTYLKLRAAAGGDAAALSAALERARVVSIGGVTAEELARQGVRVDAVAEQPDDEGLYRAILDACRRI